MNNNKLLGVIAVVLLLVGGIVGYAFHGSSHSAFGATADCQQTTCLSGGLSITSGLLQANGTLQIGSSGSSFSQVLSGTCTLTANFAITASTTRNVACAITGVLTGDKVFISLPATTSAASSKFVVTGVTASTTAGQVDISLTNTNIDGLGNTIPAATNGFGSSTQYLILR